MTTRSTTARNNQSSSNSYSNSSSNTLNDNNTINTKVGKKNNKNKCNKDEKAQIERIEENVGFEISLSEFSKFTEEKKYELYCNSLANSSCNVRRICKGLFSFQIYVFYSF
jgi:hypothetical protein